ncbi:hypothetical protein ACIQV3_35835 [Streptomyces sp. NPDC099050]|uniref:hypothetical protein n=1 Tax=Streptomyces sp. NPDC099050 TaxID=3366100 RepID=UPI0038116641
MARKTATRPARKQAAAPRRAAARTAPATTTVAGAVPRPAPAPAVENTAAAAGAQQHLAGPRAPEHTGEADWLAEQIANARDRAADLADLAREKADRDAERRLAEAAARAAATIAEADAEAGQLTAAARADVERLRADAENTRLETAAAEERRNLYAEAAARTRVYVDLADDRAARSLADVRRNLDHVEELRGQAEVLREQLAAGRTELDLAARTARVDLAEELSATRQAALDQARHDAEAARQAAQAETDTVMGQAREAARAVRAEAQQAAEAVLAEARRDAGLLRERGESEAAEAWARAEADVAALHQAARQAVDALRVSAEERAGGLLQAARDKAADTRKSADTYAAEVRRNAAAAEADLNVRLAEVGRREQDAVRLLDEAEEQGARQARREAVGEKVWRATPWAALASGVGLAASGEFQLAQLVGFDWGVAWLLPASIDIYAVTAFKRKRDVGPALSIMAVSNLAYHLAERYGVHGPDGDKIVLALTALVVITFVAIVWRVHALLDGHGKPGENEAAGPGSKAADPAIRQSGNPAADQAKPSGSPASGNPAIRPAADPAERPATHPAADPAIRQADHPAAPRPASGKPPSGPAPAAPPKSGKTPAGPSRELREKIRERVRQLMRSGGTVSHAEVARQFGLDPVTGPEYVRHQVRAVTKELATT